MYKHLHKMAKNTRKKMKKIYSKKMLKSNKKNNNKYTRRPHQTRKKVFRGGAFTPVTVDELNTGKYKLVKDIIGSCQDIRGEQKLRTQIIEGKTSINSIKHDGLDYYINYDNTGRIADIYSQNPLKRNTTQVAIVPIVPNNCSPANNIINGGAPDDGEPLQNQPLNQSGGVIRQIQGSQGKSKSLVFKDRPVSLIETEHINDGNIKTLIRQFNTKQPATIRPPADRRSQLVNTIRQPQPHPQGEQSVQSDDTIEKLKQTISIASGMSDDAAAAAANLTNLAIAVGAHTKEADTKDGDDVIDDDDVTDVDAALLADSVDNSVNLDAAAADAAAADAVSIAVRSNADAEDAKTIDDAAKSIDAIKKTTPQVPPDDLTMGLTPSPSPSPPKELTIEQLDALNARLRSKPPPTIDPTFLFDEIDKFLLRLSSDDAFAASVWLARIIKDNIALPGSSSKKIEDLFLFRLSTFPSGEETIYDKETGQTFVYPAELIVRCGLNRKLKAIYALSRNSDIVSDTIKISKNLVVADGYLDWTWRLVEIYKLEDGEKWRSRNKKHMMMEKQKSFPMTEDTPDPSPLTINAKKTLIQFVVYRDDWHIRHLPVPLLGLLRSQKGQKENYYAERFGLNVDQNQFMYGIRALNAILFSRQYRGGGPSPHSIAKDVKDILWKWVHRKELEEKKQIPSGPVWGDQYHTLPLRTAGYSGGSKTAKMRKSRSNKRNTTRTRS
jgi:hypothetical protein